MIRDRSAPRGQLHRMAVESKILADNMLGDPTEREVVVYTPAGHNGGDLPLLVDLVGFTAGGPVHVAWKNFGENVPERLDRLIGAGAMAPAVVAFPDCFTRLGGNQYVNSVAMGRWEDFLIEEMTPAVEARFNCGGDGRRAVFGKSSGGFGASVHALLHNDFWAAAASHSGDMGFEWCHLIEMPAVLRALAQHDGSIERWLRAFEAGPKWKGEDIHILMMLAQAASYDPDPDAFCGIRLPVDPQTCEIIQERWDNWMAWDPVVIADRAVEGLKNLKGLWIDCGDVDQYNLVYGARRFHAKLEQAGVEHVYEEFPDNHSSVDYRMDKSLPFLVSALS